MSDMPSSRIIHAESAVCENPRCCLLRFKQGRSLIPCDCIQHAYSYDPAISSRRPPCGVLALEADRRTGRIFRELATHRPLHGSTDQRVRGWLRHGCSEPSSSRSRSSISGFVTSITTASGRTSITASTSPGPFGSRRHVAPESQCHVHPRQHRPVATDTLSILLKAVFDTLPEGYVMASKCCPSRVGRRRVLRPARTSHQPGPNARRRSRNDTRG